LAAVFYALEGAWMKRLSKEGVGPVFVAWATSAGIVPLLWLAAWREGVPQPSPGFWLPCLGAVATNAVALVLYFKALSTGELSLVYPLLSLTPAWMLLSAHAITGEFPSPVALTGVALVTAGCYGLGLDGGGPLSPFRRLARSAGAREALAAGILWSLSANFDRVAVQAYSRYAYPALHGLFLIVLLLPFAWKADRADFDRFAAPKRLAGVLVQTLLGTGVVLFQFAAVELTQATHVIAVKRAGMVLAAYFGYRFYGESLGPRKLAFSAVVLLGLALLA
jgi:drug/metabolite transporter (DMT)-like permease